MIAYELVKRAGDREIEEMIKTLPNNRQKSIVQNDAVEAERCGKNKKARETKKSQSQQGKESKDDVFESLDSKLQV